MNLLDIKRIGRPIIDLTSQRFGMLEVLEYAGQHSSTHYALWKCKCDCGNIKIVESGNLKSGGTKSCGCLLGKWNAVLTEKTKQICTKCGIEKDISEFCKGSKYASGIIKYRNRCKECMHKIEQKRFKNLKEKRLCITCSTPIIDRGIYCEKCKTRRNEVNLKICNDLKIKSIQYLGNKCIKCGLESEYLYVYDFHHVDLSKKKFNIARLINRGKLFEIIKKELDKCMLLCNNCHRIRHEKPYNILLDTRCRDTKRKMIEYMGGKCIDCGIKSEHEAIYDFHHINPDEKLYKLSTMGHRRWSIIMKELEKCVLLCSNCHRIRHEKEILEKYKGEVI